MFRKRSISVISLSLPATVPLLQFPMGRDVLTDQFDWEISELNSPEDTATIMCADLGLAPVYANHIAFAIREQVLNALKVSVLE